MQADMNWFAVLAHHADRTPDKAITVFEGETTTYARDGRRAPALAGGLHRARRRSGDVVGLLSYNCPEFLETIFAANYLGAIAMPINWRLAAPEVRYILEHSEARALVCDEALVELAERGDRRASRTRSSGPACRPAARRMDGAGRSCGAPARAGCPRRGRPADDVHRLDVHVGDHGPAQGRDDHPRQPGVEEPGPHRRVRLHRRRSRPGLRPAVPRRRARPHDHVADRRRGDDRSSTARSTPPTWSTSSSGRG